MIEIVIEITLIKRAKLVKGGWIQDVRGCQADGLQIPGRQVAAAPLKIARHVAELSGEVQQNVGREIAAAAAGGDPNGRVRLNGYTMFASAVK